MCVCIKIYLTVGAIVVEMRRGTVDQWIGVGDLNVSARWVKDLQSAESDLKQGVQNQYSIPFLGGTP